MRLEYENRRGTKEKRGINVNYGGCGSLEMRTYDAMSRPRFLRTYCVSSAASMELVPHLCIQSRFHKNLYGKVKTHTGYSPVTPCTVYQWIVSRHEKRIPPAPTK